MTNEMQDMFAYAFRNVVDGFLNTETLDRFKTKSIILKEVQKSKQFIPKKNSLFSQEWISTYTMSAFFYYLLAIICLGEDINTW